MGGGIQSNNLNGFFVEISKYFILGNPTINVTFFLGGLSGQILSTETLERHAHSVGVFTFSVMPPTNQAAFKGESFRFLPVC